MAIIQEVNICKKSLKEGEKKWKDQAPKRKMDRGSHMCKVRCQDVGWRGGGFVNDAIHDKHQKGNIRNWAKTKGYTWRIKGYMSTPCHHIKRTMN